jgi:alpha-L-rhamnosidase
MTRALAACLAGLLAQTAPSTHADGGLPITDAVLSRQWKAQWLTCPGAPARDEGVYRFRRVLELPAAPARFVVHVSGDQRFVLFANGQRVGIGPSRGDPSYWRFETFDLAPFLKPSRR